MREKLECLAEDETFSRRIGAFKLNFPASLASFMLALLSVMPTFEDPALAVLLWIESRLSLRG